MANETDLHRDIGVLQGRLSALETQVRDNQARTESAMAQMAQSMRDMAKQVSEVHDAMLTAKGGMRTLIATSGASATLGGLVMAAVQLLRGH